jgi:hypothetical protein
LNFWSVGSDCSYSRVVSRWKLICPRWWATLELRFFHRPCVNGLWVVSWQLSPCNRNLLTLHIYFRNGVINHQRSLHATYTYPNMYCLRLC